MSCIKVVPLPLYRRMGSWADYRDDGVASSIAEAVVHDGDSHEPQRIWLCAGPSRLLLGPSAQRALLLELCPQPLERRGALGEQPLELGPFLDARRRLRLRRIATLPLALVRLFGRGNPPEQVAKLLLGAGDVGFGAHSPCLQRAFTRGPLTQLGFDLRHPQAQCLELFQGLPCEL